MFAFKPCGLFCFVILFVIAFAAQPVRVEGRVPFFPLQPETRQLQLVVTGLSSPVFVTNANDGSNRLFIVEQGGIIKVLQPGSSTPTNFLNITSRVLSGGERGLLGLAFHPQYTTNRRFFVYYTRAGDGAIQVAEYKVSIANPNVADTAELVIITIAHSANSNHNGGTVAFGSDGYLYLGPGDGGGANDTPNNAQNINQLLGKVLRIDVNGAAPYTSPSTNPFFGATAGADEIYAMGVRNPYRFSFDRGGTRQLYLADVGQGNWEEINIISLFNGTSCGNYGWRVMEGNHCNPNINGGSCTAPSNYVPPIAEYSSGPGSSRCSITGGYVYRGGIGTFPTGAYVYGDYCTGEILMLEGTTQTVVITSTVNISGFGEDETGEIYVVGLGGTLHRIINPPTSAGMTISGSINSAAGSGVGRVWVTLLDTFTNETRTEQTRGDGSYTFTDVPSGRFYIISAAKKRYVFTPGTHVFMLVGNISSLNFTAALE